MKNKILNQINPSSLFCTILIIFLALFSGNLLAQNQVGQTINGKGDGLSHSANGNRLAIGNTTNTNRGSVTTYDLLGNAWVKVGQTIFGEIPGDAIGSAISLSDDGNRIAIGSSINGGRGHVRVFSLVNNVWTQLGVDIEGQHTGGGFGSSVAISGDGSTIVVGSPGFNNDEGMVQIYEWNSGSWVQKGNDRTLPPNQSNGGAWHGESMGTAVDISIDGSVIAIGAPYARINQEGAIITMEWTGIKWGYTGQIGGGFPEDHLGTTVSISNDGNTVAGSAPDAGGSILWATGETNVYKKISNLNWNLVLSTGGEGADYADEHDLSGDGKRLIIGYPDAYAYGGGVIEVYEDNGSWSRIAKVEGQDFNGNFGYRTSINKGGDIVTVSEADGEVRSYKLGYVRGKIFLDLNQNCTAEQNEIYLENKFGIINPGNLVVQTQSDGVWQYNDTLPPGQYTFTVDTSGHWTSSCPVTQNFTVLTNQFAVIVPDVGITSTLDYTNPNVETVMPIIRPCTNQFIYIKVCNEPNATTSIDSAWVIVEIDTALTMISMTVPYTDLGNNQYQVYLDTLSPGQCQSFSMNVFVSCFAQLGQAVCINTELFPTSYCNEETLPNPYPPIINPCTSQWDGSDLEVIGYCQNDTIVFEITNMAGIGNDMTCYSPVSVYVDGTLTLIDSVQLMAGQTQLFQFPGSGESWHLTVLEHPLHPGNSKESATVENCGGATIPSLINLFDQNDKGDCVAVFCGIVTGSFDPNDKRGFPLGRTEDHFIDPNQQLQYIVRFQNTGTDTAFNVVILDTLDQDLDALSFRSGPASHAHSHRILGNNVIEWTFPNIMLPDSNVNEPASHGFVSFTIDQMPDLPEGTIINNSVGIYFDFNAPVITNTTVHTINYEFSGTDVVSACGSYTWIDGITYTSSNNTATQLVTSSLGFDSLVTLNLTIYNDVNATDTHTACESYTWIDGTTYTSSTSTPIYIIVGGAANGCDSIVTLDLTINNNTSGTDIQTACGAYTWIDGITYTSSTNTPTFTIFGGAANGCDSIVSLDLTIEPTIDNTVSVSGGIITANQAGATYQWLDCDNGNQPIPGETNQAFMPTATGNYAVEISMGSCTGVSDCTYIVMTNTTELSENTFKVYPNPTYGVVNIEFEQLQKMTTVQLTDITGKVIRVFTIEQENQLQFELEGASGIYLLAIMDATGSLTTRKVVLK